MSIKYTFSNIYFNLVGQLLLLQKGTEKSALKLFKFVHIYYHFLVRLILVHVTLSPKWIRMIIYCNLEKLLPILV